MSDTYHIACMTCKESIWVAQGYSSTLYFYNGEPDTVQYFNEFLRKHLSTKEYGAEHLLVFWNSQTEPEHYKEDERVYNENQGDPYFYWVLKKNKTKLVLQEYNGNLVPLGDPVTQLIYKLTHEGWKVVTVTNTKPKP